jgi:DNA polymerase III sliding clamp (beta) subunit (PCNA family)
VAPNDREDSRDSPPGNVAEETESREPCPEDDAEAETLRAPKPAPPPPAPDPPAPSSVSGSGQRELDVDVDGAFEATVGMDVLRAWLEPIRALADECCVEVSREGLRVATVDAAHVAMIRTTLARGAFEHFEVEEPKDPAGDGVVTIGVDVDKVAEALRLAPGPDASVRLWTKGASLFLRIGPLTRRTRLLDTARFVEPRIPDVRLPARITARVEDLMLGIRGAQGVSDHVALIAEPGMFRMAGEGDGNATTLELHAEDGDVTVEGAGGDTPVRSLFPLDTLGKVLRAVWAEEVEIALGRDYPLRLTWTPTVERGDVVIRVGTCEVRIAPRIESG